MPEYAGKIEYSNTGTNYIPPAPSTISYTHSPDDIIIASAGPDANGDTDNVRVMLQYDAQNGWEIIVSDSSYTGAVYFRIVFRS